MKKWILGWGIMGMCALQGVETSPEKEFEYIQECAKSTHAPLSVVLRDLTVGISDESFDEAFIAKIAALEKKAFDGEYVEHWGNGQLKIRAFFKKGKVDGHVHGWYQDGKEAFKAFFYEEKKVGVHLAVAPYAPRRCNGGPVRLRYYNEEGKLDGQQQADYLVGWLKTIAAYENGVLNGRVEFCYSPDLGSNDVEEREYKDGKLISKRMRAPKGSMSKDQGPKVSE